MRDRSPTTPQARVTRWFLAGLALVNLAAFGSLAVQITGLAGAQGILPVGNYLSAVAARHGAARFWLFPTVFWLNASDLALQAACGAGLAAAACLLLDWWRRTALALLFGLYLSLFYAGQVFMDFQWDLLLLETNVLALLLCRHPCLLLWGLRCLVCRFMLMSGLVKLQGGDAGWRDFSVLRHHFETQPLPTPLAWSVARWPTALLAAGAVVTLLVESIVPFGLLLPQRLRRVRHVAAWATIGFQCAIVATGNFGWFNLLVIVLCIGAFDGATLRRASAATGPAVQGLPPPPAWAVAALAASVVLGLLQTLATAAGPATPRTVVAITEVVLPWHVVNRYGPFQTVTTERPELVVDVSADGTHWQEIDFRHKPGDVRRPPHWNVPHQPRLDWQLWFAALGTLHDQPWFVGFARGVLRHDAPVLALLDDSTRAACAHATALRVQLNDYRFATPAERATGEWWLRQPTGLWLPPVRLGSDGELAPLAAE